MRKTVYVCDNCKAESETFREFWVSDGYEYNGVDNDTTGAHWCLCYSCLVRALCDLLKAGGYEFGSIFNKTLKSYKRTPTDKDWGRLVRWQEEKKVA